jgi:hypothetical protein
MGDGGPCTYHRAGEDLGEKNLHVNALEGRDRNHLFAIPSPNLWSWSDLVTTERWNFSCVLLLL